MDSLTEWIWAVEIYYCSIDQSVLNGLVPWALAAGIIVAAAVLPAEEHLYHVMLNIYGAFYS